MAAVSSSDGHSIEAHHDAGVTRNLADTAHSPREPIAMPRKRRRKSVPSKANYVVALARGIAILRAFENRQEKMTLAEISAIVHLTRATVSRHLHTLQALRYIEASGRYFRLSSKVLTLSQAYYASNLQFEAVQPFIDQVSKLTGAPCAVSVLMDREVTCVARSYLRSSSAMDQEIGVTLPAYCTATGRLFLAALSEEDLAVYFHQVERKKYNHKTLTDEASLRGILARARRDDFCMIDGEYELHSCAAAVPLRDASGHSVAAVHVSADADFDGVARLARDCLPALQQASEKMRDALFFGHLSNTRFGGLVARATAPTIEQRDVDPPV